MRLPHALCTLALALSLASSAARADPPARSRLLLNTTGKTVVRKVVLGNDETIAVVFFLDVGLERCQQMFADLNRHAIRPSTSLGVLYDHRDDGARLVKLSILQLGLFKDLTEMERSTLSARSRKLFTLSALYGRGIFKLNLG